MNEKEKLLAGCAAISSKENPLVKQARALRQKKAREESGLFLVEGLRLCEEALQAELKISYGLFTEDFLRDERAAALLTALCDKGLALYRMPPPLLTHCADTEQPQGIMLIAEKPVPLSALPPQASFVLVLDGLRDPGNLGTILRAAQAAALDAVMLLPGCVDVYNPKAVRSAMGASFSLPLLFPASLPEARQMLQEAGLRILLAAAGGRAYDEVSLREPLALVLGAEAEGASPFWRETNAETIGIPMPGGTESLNVAVSAGILLCEVLRQRKA